MEKKKRNKRKLNKAIFSTFMSLLILFVVLGNPYTAKAEKVWNYTELSTIKNDGIGTFLYPGDVIKVREDGYLEVRYYIDDGQHSDYDLLLGRGYVPFKAAWGSATAYEDTDDYLLYKNDFTFPTKPDTGDEDFYIYEVYEIGIAYTARNLKDGGQAENCILPRVKAYPAYRTAFHDGFGNVIDADAKNYVYEAGWDSENAIAIYYFAFEDDQAPLLEADSELGELIGWSDSEDYLIESESEDSNFFALDGNYAFSSTPGAVSGTYDLYPVYEYYETVLEVSAEDFSEGQNPSDYLQIETNRPQTSEMRNYKINYILLNDDGTTENVEGEPAKPGHYKVVVSLDKTGETIVNSDGFLESRAWSSATASAEFNIISGAVLSTKPSANTLTYNGSSQSLVSEGSATGGTVCYSLSKDGDFTPAVPSAKDAGKYTVWYMVRGEGGRSDISPASVDVTISPKTVGLSWSGTEYEYDGSSHCPSATATGLCTGDSCDVTVSGTQTDAGTYTATATALSNSNYALPSAKTIEFTITQKSEEEKAEEEEEEVEETVKEKGSVSVSMAGFYYGGAQTSPVITSTTNDVKGAKVTYKPAGSADSAYTPTVPKEVGRYIVKVTLPANDKYNACSATAEFSIIYLPTPDNAYSIKGSKGEDGWYTSDVTITPGAGYQISYGDRNHYSNNGVKIERNVNQVFVYIRNESTFEETDVITIGGFKIDSKSPKVEDMESGEVYFADESGNVICIVSDENLSHVVIGENKVKLTDLGDGRKSFAIPAGAKKEAVSFTAYDLAGNKTEFNVITAPSWKRNGVISEGELFLEAGERFTIPEGKWVVDGDSTVYMGGSVFYASKEGMYAFKKQ